MKKSRYVKVIEGEEVIGSNESTVLHLTKLLISKKKETQSSSEQ